MAGGSITAKQENSINNVFAVGAAKKSYSTQFCFAYHNTVINSME